MIFRDKPRTFNGDLSSLPPALAHLREQKVWVCWKWFWDGKKWTKPPYRTDAPDYHAATSKPETWGSHEEAVKQVLAGRADGIGFTLCGRNIGGIDLDHCRNPDTGEITTWASEYLQQFPDAYVEATVSGRGLRILGTSSREAFAPKFKLPALGDGAAVEMFSNSKHYLTLACNEIGSCRQLPSIEAGMSSIADKLGKPEQSSEFDFDAATNMTDLSDRSPHRPRLHVPCSPWCPPRTDCAG
jgi:hypothetical protein